VQGETLKTKPILAIRENSCEGKFPLMTFHDAAIKLGWALLLELRMNDKV
jgi:hypothetical protein